MTTPLQSGVPELLDARGSRLNDRARWPDLAGVDIRFRANFAYVNGRLADGTVLKLCRFRYGGSAYTWGFALHRQPRRLRGHRPPKRHARRQC